MGNGVSLSLLCLSIMDVVNTYVTEDWPIRYFGGHFEFLIILAFQNNVLGSCDSTSIIPQVFGVSQKKRPTCFMDVFLAAILNFR